MITYNGNNISVFRPVRPLGISSGSQRENVSTPAFEPNNINATTGRIWDTVGMH